MKIARSIPVSHYWFKNYKSIRINSWSLRWLASYQESKLCEPNGERNDQKGLEIDITPKTNMQKQIKKQKEVTLHDEWIFPSTFSFIKIQKMF